MTSYEAESRSIRTTEERKFDEASLFITVVSMLIGVQYTHFKFLVELINASGIVFITMYNKMNSCELFSFFVVLELFICS